MAFGVPPVYSGTPTRRRTAPPTGTTTPSQTTTTTTTAPPPPPSSPVPTGTTPQPPSPTPTLPTTPIVIVPPRTAQGPPHPTQGYPTKTTNPLIPYENNQLISPTQWSQRWPTVPYPTQSVRPEDAQAVIVDQYNRQTADTLDRQLSGADTLAAQYDAWLRSTQARSLGQLTSGVASATGINNLNNRALEQSARNQLGLNMEQRIRNGFDQQGVEVSNRYIGNLWGLAGEQRDADIGRIRGQWALRNGQVVSDQDYIRGVWGRATEQFGADQAQSAAMADQARLGYGYAANDLQNTTNRVSLQEQANRRSATSEAAGRGSFGSAGFRDNISDIGELASLSRESAWNQYEQRRDATTGELRDIDYGRGNLDRRYAGEVADFQKQLEDNQRGYESDVLGYRYGIGQADRDFRGTTASLAKQLEDNKLAKLGLQSMARSYGIQDRDIMQTLETATQRNNINLAQLIGEMNATYAQGDADRIFQFNQFLHNLIGI